VSQRPPPRGLREVERRKRELSEQAALQRAALSRGVAELSGSFRWLWRGWALARALRAGLRG